MFSFYFIFNQTQRWFPYSRHFEISFPGKRDFLRICKRNWRIRRLLAVFTHSNINLRVLSFSLPSPVLSCISIGSFERKKLESNLPAAASWVVLSRVIFLSRSRHFLPLAALPKKNDSRAPIRVGRLSLQVNSHPSRWGLPLQQIWK